MDNFFLASSLGSQNLLQRVVIRGMARCTAPPIWMRLRLCKDFDVCFIARSNVGAEDF